MYLLGIAELMANTRSELTERLSGIAVQAPELRPSNATPGLRKLAFFHVGGGPLSMRKKSSCIKTSFFENGITFSFLS